MSGVKSGISISLVVATVVVEVEVDGVGSVTVGKGTTPNPISNRSGFSGNMYLAYSWGCLVGEWIPHGTHSMGLPWGSVVSERAERVAF